MEPQLHEDILGPEDVILSENEMKIIHEGVGRRDYEKVTQIVKNYKVLNGLEKKLVKVSLLRSLETYPPRNSYTYEYE